MKDRFVPVPVVLEGKGRIRMGEVNSPPFAVCRMKADQTPHWISPIETFNDYADAEKTAITLSSLWADAHHEFRKGFATAADYGHIVTETELGFYIRRRLLLWNDWDRGFVAIEGRINPDLPDYGFSAYIGLMNPEHGELFRHRVMFTRDAAVAVKACKSRHLRRELRKLRLRG